MAQGSFLRFTSLWSIFRTCLWTLKLGSPISQLFNAHPLQSQPLYWLWVKEAKLPPATALLREEGHLRKEVTEKGNCEDLLPNCNLDTPIVEQQREVRHLSWSALFQIVCATIDNNKIILDIDNSRMAADDFRVKWVPLCADEPPRRLPTPSQLICGVLVH